MMKQPSKSFPGRALPLDIQVMKTTPNRQSLTQHKNPDFYERSSGEPGK